MAKETSATGVLAAGGIAAILASGCCLGPLVLVSLGLGGAWIGNLTALEPFRPVFVGAALVAVFFAYRRIFRPAAECKPGEVCARPQAKRAYKAMFGVVAASSRSRSPFPTSLHGFTKRISR
jgi:mercuric ion transport protein